MNLKNILRTLFNIRSTRLLNTPGPMPQVGSSIVFENFKIKLKCPINHEQWYWFTQQGWRMIDTRINRRQYIVMPDKVVVKLLDINGTDREELHQRMLNMNNEEFDEWFNRTHHKEVS